MASERILIIGGGLGGLCLAQGLKRAGIPFALFERGSRIEQRDQGYRLRINAAGQDALARCLPVDLLYLLYQSATQADADPWCIDEQLKPVSANTPQSWASGAAALPDLVVHRQTLREILQCGLTDDMHFEHRLESFHETTGGVLARFANGIEVQGQLLVGADGARSAIREQLLPNVVPEDIGHSCIYGRVPATPANCQAIGRDLCAGTSIIRADGFTGIVDVMAFREPMPVLASRIAPDCRLTPVDDYVYWALTGSNDRLGLSRGSDRGWDTGDIVWRLVRHWAPGLQALFLRGDPGEWAIQSIRSLSPAHIWSSRQATLLGDAAHVMSPAGGLGASTALQDAVDLATLLARAWASGELEPALRHYEAEMRVRGSDAVKVSLAGSEILSDALAA